MIKDIMYGPTENDGAIPVLFSTIDLNLKVFRRLLDVEIGSCFPSIRYNWQKKRLECHIVYASGYVNYFEIYEHQVRVQNSEELVEKILENMN